MSSPASPLASPLPWDLVADDYASEVVPYFEHYAREALRLAAVTPEQAVLDVACGPGTLSLLAARMGAQVSALDFAEEMVGRCRARFAAAGLRVDLRAGDGQDLPFQDETFDAGFSMFGLMFFPDRVRGLAELRRVVRPGGAVVVSSWRPLGEVPALDAIFSALREEMPNLPVGGAAGPLGTEEAIHEETAQAGLSRVEIVPESHAAEYANAPEFWASMERTLAPLVLLKHRLGEDWAPMRARLQERVLSSLGEGPVSYEMKAWLTVARR